MKKDVMLNCQKHKNYKLNSFELKKNHKEEIYSLKSQINNKRLLRKN